MSGSTPLQAARWRQDRFITGDHFLGNRSIGGTPLKSYPFYRQVLSPGKMHSCPSTVPQSSPFPRPAPFRRTGQLAQEGPSGLSAENGGVRVRRVVDGQ